LYGCVYMALKAKQQEKTVIQRQVEAGLIVLNDKFHISDRKVEDLLGYVKYGISKVGGGSAPGSEQMVKAIEILIQKCEAEQKTKPPTLEECIRAIVREELAAVNSDHLHPKIDDTASGEVGTLGKE
jgi:hypothetical protein